jgi:hypothetical protein
MISNSILIYRICNGTEIYSKRIDTDVNACGTFDHTSAPNCYFASEMKNASYITSYEVAVVNKPFSSTFRVF